MKFESIRLQETLSALGQTIAVLTDKQIELFSDIRKQITEISTDFNEDAMTVDLLHEHIIAEVDFGIPSKEEENVNTQIDALFIEYVKEHGTEPQYAECTIRYLDENFTHNYTIKLSSDIVEEEDDSIFFYCNSLAELKSLTLPGIGEFIIIKCLSLE